MSKIALQRGKSKGSRFNKDSMIVIDFAYLNGTIVLCFLGGLLLTCMADHGQWHAEDASSLCDTVTITKISLHLCWEGNLTVTC